MNKPKKTSAIEDRFALHVRAAQLPAPTREHRFAAPDRQWRFDFCWPDLLIAAELEGGVWTGGRHTRGSGFTEDCEKYNAAAARGWRVYRFTGVMVRTGQAVKVIEHAIKAATAARAAQQAEGAAC